MPDPTGRYLFAGGHGVFDMALKKTADAVRSEDPSPREPPIHQYLPARDGPFYFRYHVTGLPQGPGFPGGPPPMLPGPGRPGMPPGAGGEAELSIYVFGQLKPIAQLKVPDPFAGEPINPMMLFGRLPQHIHLIPSVKMLVIVPMRGDKIHMIPFDAAAAMTKAGVDVPWITSLPPRSFKAGESITHVLKLNGKAAGIKHMLESPADGMNVAADGTFTWKVPAEPPAEVRVTIRVKAPGGESVHSFVMTKK